MPDDRLLAWSKAVGWNKLINRQGTTWRKLDSAAQARADDAAGAQALVLANPSVIKRPLVEWGDPSGAVSVGFDALLWADMAAKKHG